MTSLLRLDCAVPWREARSSSTRSGKRGASRAATASPTTPAPMTVTPVSGTRHPNRFAADERAVRVVVMRSGPSIVLIALAVLGCAGRPSPSGASSPPPPRGGAPRVLFVGNSLTEGNHLPAMVAALARASGQPLEVEAVTRGGFSLEDHWNQGDARRAVARG